MIQMVSSETAVVDGWMDVKAVSRTTYHRQKMQNILIRTQVSMLSRLSSSFIEEVFIT
jgi:hypothetical protein